MTKQIFIFLMCAAGLIATSSHAQTANDPKRVAIHNDWHVFEADNPKECFAISAPKSVVNSRGGVVVQGAKRSDIRLFVFYRPSENVKGQVTFTGGYTFAKGRSIELKVDTSAFNMSTSGEWAWPITAADDQKIVDAMRRGSKAVVTAQSARPTVTVDSFSLIGFTAAVEDAAKRCGG